MHELTKLQVERIARNGAPGKYYDGGNLFLRKTNRGSLLWQFKYRHGRENTASFGVWPEVSLLEARRKAQAAREMLAVGVDPNEQKRRSRARLQQDYSNTLRAVAERWIEVHLDDWVPEYMSKVQGRLRGHVYPSLGDMPVGQISSKEIILLLRRIEASGARETALRVNSLLGRVFRFAIREGLIDRDPCHLLHEVLKRPERRHMPALIKPDEVAKYLRAANRYREANPVVGAALQLLPRLLLRPGELRRAEWGDVDFEHAELRIPSERMKRSRQEKEKGEPHIVPLSLQVLDILHELKVHTGPCGPLFRGVRAPTMPISDGTINAALRRMGYSTREQVTAHGFRATARTLGVEVLHEREAVVEAQLAHVVKDHLGRSYNRATYLDDRRRFMQSWSDYLDRLQSA